MKNKAAFSPQGRVTRALLVAEHPQLFLLPIPTFSCSCPASVLVETRWMIVGTSGGAASRISQHQTGLQLREDPRWEFGVRNEQSQGFLVSKDQWEQPRRQALIPLGSSCFFAKFVPNPHLWDSQKGGESAFGRRFGAPCWNISSS